MTRNQNQRVTLKLEFRSMRFGNPAILVNGSWRRVKRKVLFANYEWHNLSEPSVFPDHQVNEGFKQKTFKNFSEAGNCIPNASLCVVDSLDKWVQVWITPMRDEEAPMPLTLQMFDSKNCIQANVPTHEYLYYRDIAINRELSAPEFMQEIYIELGRATALEDDFGFSIPILSLLSRAPVIEEVLRESWPSEESPLAFPPMPIGYKPSSDGRTREEISQSIFKLLGD